ncbi:unnamed protein product [Cyclocybe aegerita]|uniref:Uncharacterized protein n=1 Tax=Cyclocybe aegerita TaxID=1973307 RepID=A0A8S0X9F3_CYCAE|nr:unnamed protein product [Cyclocybe aegerita]
MRLRTPFQPIFSSPFSKLNLSSDHTGVDERPVCFDDHDPHLSIYLRHLKVKISALRREVSTLWIKISCPNFKKRQAGLKRARGTFASTCVNEPSACTSANRRPIAREEPEWRFKRCGGRALSPFRRHTHARTEPWNSNRIFDRPNNALQPRATPSSHHKPSFKITSRKI